MGSGTPTFALPGASFLGLEKRPAAYEIVGIPYDLGTSNRAGTRFGPDAIRLASRMLIDGDHPTHWVDPKKLDVADIGNFDIHQGDIPTTMDKIHQQALEHDHLIAIGGDHSVSLPLLRAIHQSGYPNGIGLIHFDAHIDTWADNFGGVPFGHGNPFYHAIEEGLIEPHRMIQIGVRSPMDRRIHDWTISQGVTIWSAIDVHSHRPFEVANRIKQIVGDEPVYLTIDIDVLDPAFAPGTGTPEVGGLAVWQVQEILRNLIPLYLIGMDLVEVAPAYDVSQITALAGATLIWEYLSILAVQEFSR